MVNCKVFLNFVVTCVLLISSNCFAGIPKININDLHTITTKAHELIGFNGSVLIAQDDNIIYENAFGYADKTKKIELTPQHLLSTGSISKEFTTVAMIMLEEQGKIKYGDKVSQYLKNLPQWGSEITIEQILSHTSGLPQIEWRLNLDTNMINKQLMSIESLKFTPGTDFLYGNFNVLLRAYIIEKVTKQPFTSFIQRSLFTPAKMESTYNKTELSDRRSSVVVGDYTSAILGISYFSTPKDLFLWEKALVNNIFISKASMKKALAPHALSGMHSRAYFDLGNFEKNEHGEMTLLLHDGSNPDHHAIKANHLKKRLKVILMSSDGRKTTLFELNDYIAKIAQYVNNETPASWWLNNEIKLSNFPHAFKKLKTKIKNNHSLIITEDALNRLGYSFARKNEFVNAIDIMELNNQLFPFSANTYDSYAELLVHTKQYKKALPVIQHGIALAEKANAKGLIKYLKKHLTTVNKNLL